MWKVSHMQWFTQDEDYSYTHRLEAIGELGKLFPGVVIPLGHENRRLGFFAGIYLQTKWQLDSGRDQLPLWFFVNHSLTLAPYAYAQEFLKNPHLPYEESAYVKKHPTRDAVHAPITVVDTCKAWKKYFSRKSLRLIWRAHTISIRYSLWQYAEEFENINIPSEEVAFWQGWIRFILSLESVSPPTNDFFIRIPLDLTMPKFSPLGQTVNKGHIIQRTFLKRIMQNSMNQKEFLQKYGRLDSF